TSWARSVCSVTTLPIIADGDDGYGSPLTAMRAVEEFERANVAGITVEDQEHPKRCGHLEGKRCIPAVEAAHRLRAVLDARADKDFFVIARTDAYSASGGSLDAAIERAKRYAGVGVDMIWPEFPSPDRGD